MCCTMVCATQYEGKDKATLTKGGLISERPENRLPEQNRICREDDYQSATEAERADDREDSSHAASTVRRYPDA